MSPLDLRDDDTTIGDDEALVARLLAAAGPPPPAPELEVARIQEAARAEWRRRYAGRAAPPRRLWPFAAAAALVLAVVAALVARHAPAPAVPPVARVERAVGASGPAGRSLGAGDTLVVGERIRVTADGAAALALPDGRSVRLAGGSHLRIATSRDLELVAGAIYVDSRDASAASAPVVRTPLGWTFRELGTQFEVRLLAGSTARLRVREGSVAGPNGPPAVAGEEVRFGPRREVVRDRVELHGPAWAWVVAAAPRPSIEGWSLDRYLDWLGREVGWQILYATPEDEALARAVILHGSIAHLGVEESAEVVTRSAGFELRNEADGLKVASRGSLRTPS